MHTTTNSGLHEFVAERVLTRYARPGIRAADLGSGPGAMAARLHSFGCDVLAVDRTAEGFEAGLPHVALDFDQNDFASELGPASFDLVTAIEVIEHVESPIGFLRNIGRLLAPRGVALITTPNVDSLPARAKFLLTGKIRTMDEFSEPTHISPIFWDLLRRQFLARALPLSSERLPAVAQAHSLDVSNGRCGIPGRFHSRRQPYSRAGDRSVTLDVGIC